MTPRVLWLLPLLAAAVGADARPPSAESKAPTEEASRFALRSAQWERAGESNGRFALQGRFAPAESAGELREGGDFVLIGRLAKAAVNCGSGTIFRDGFEDN